MMCQGENCTYIMMSRNVPKVAHSKCFNRTELNTPLPPLVARVATPDMGHTKNP